MKHLAVVVDWYGPYTTKSALLAAKFDYCSGLYIAIGKTRYQRGKSTLQYMGLSKNLSLRLSRHHKIQNVTRDMKIWLGEVSTPEVSGPKRIKTSSSMDAVEWVHSYFLDLPLNERKKINPPSRSATVLNRWWNVDYITPRKKRPHPMWPDLFDYLGKDRITKIIWFGSKQIKVKPNITT